MDIRINIEHLEHDTARAALRLARNATKTESKPRLSPPNDKGFYYAFVYDERQAKVFVGFLMTASIKFEDRTGLLPRGAGRPSKPSTESPKASSSKPLKEVVDEVLDVVGSLFKGNK